MYKVLSIVFVFTHLLLQCCASDRENQYIDPALKDVVYEAQTWLGLSSIESSVSLQDTQRGERNAGVCVLTRNNVKRPVIYINRSWYNRINDEQAILLVMIHELAHCELHKGHVEEPTHIMFRFYNFALRKWKYGNDVIRLQMIQEVYETTNRL